MTRMFTLAFALAVGCSGLLWLLGDFAAYVGEPADRDLFVVLPSSGQRLLAAIAVGGLFTALVTALFLGSGRLLPRHELLRVFVILAGAFTPLVYYYGDFKTYLGGLGADGRCQVFYELPRGPGRWALSAVGGVVLAAVSTAGAWVYRGLKDGGSAFQQALLARAAAECQSRAVKCRTRTGWW